MDDIDNIAMKNEECEEYCRNVIYEHLLGTRDTERAGRRITKRTRRREVLSEIFIILHVIASVVLIDHQQFELVDSAEGILPRNYLSLGNNHWRDIANTIRGYRVYTGYRVERSYFLAQSNLLIKIYIKK